jgi:CRP-like cAMP-binding protein
MEEGPNRGEMVTQELVLTKKPDDITEILRAAMDSHPIFEEQTLDCRKQLVEAVVENVYDCFEVVIEQVGWSCLSCNVGPPKLQLLCSPDACEQGRAGEHFYIVTSGTFEAYEVQEGAYDSFKKESFKRRTSTGADNEASKLLKLMRPGDSFGELALIFDSPRACSVRRPNAAYRTRTVRRASTLGSL